VMTNEPEPLKEALVSVDPRTGAVRAYYGGESGTGNDYAEAQRQPGSSIKPYVLATALEQGIGVNARRDGSSPQTFPDRPDKPVRNSGGASCSACTLTEAMVKSLNTTFYGLAYEVGPENVAETVRKAAGMPDVWEQGQFKGQKTLANSNGGTGSSIGIGEYEMRPIDQAVGFATLASGGIQRDPYFVAKVADSAGAVLLETTPDAGERVMQEDVANDVTFALKGVAQASKRALDGGREVASKTGTVGSSDTDNSDAWMVGYTPSISTAVWMGNDKPSDPIVNASGRIIYGSGLPGAIWQRFMNTVLAGTPKEDLPDKPLIDGDTGEGIPEPTTEAPAPAPEPAPTTAPEGPLTPGDGTNPDGTNPTPTPTPTPTQPGVGQLPGQPPSPSPSNPNGNGNGNGGNGG